MKTATITIREGEFRVETIPSNSHIWVRHVESKNSTVYTSMGHCTSTLWPYRHVKEINNAVRALNATPLKRESRRPRVISAA